MTSRPGVVIFDYGSGNIRSAERALTRAGAHVVVSSSSDDAIEADGVMVPGVGAFAACMASLLAVDGARMVAQRVAAKRPLLGVCVGHQVLFAGGSEHGVATAGLGVWPGEVCEVAAPVLPHVGWNTVTAPAASAMFAGIGAERFSYLHSYAAHLAPVLPALVSWTSYGEDTFIAAVEDGSLWSTQFHPEKSGDAGISLLRNWLATL